MLLIPPRNQLFRGSFCTRQKEACHCFRLKEAYLSQMGSAPLGFREGQGCPPQW